MRHYFLSFLTIFAFISATFSLISGSDIEDARDGLIGGYTPAEIRRNAQRQALGMRPIPPRALKKKSGKLVRDVSGEDEHLTSIFESSELPFSVPDQTSTGHIGIHEGSVHGPLLGYLNGHKLVSTPGEAGDYTYTTTGSVMDINVLHSKQRMSVTAGLYGQALGLGKKNFHMARHSRQSTLAGDTPFHDPDTSLYLETAVFVINSHTGEVGVTWVNPDGSHPPVQIALREERIYYTGDLSSFREYLGDDDEVISIVYKWIPVRPK